MASSERELRDSVERLQTELREARAALVRERDAVARLTRVSAQERDGRAQAEAALAAADARAREADAAFQHALGRLAQARQERTLARGAPEPAAHVRRAGPWWNMGIRPDRFELWLRFAVGAVVGGGSGLYLASELALTSAVATAGVVLLSAVVTGVLAWWYGDRYWLG